MKMKKTWLISLALLALLLAACAPENQPPAAETPPASQTPPPEMTGSPLARPTQASPTPAENEILPPAAVLAALERLAGRLNVSTGDIQIREIEQVQWPDSCLGAGRPDESCLLVITPGYRVTLEYDGQRYTFHTDADGGQVVEAPPALPQVEGTVLAWELSADGACSRLEIGPQGALYGACDGALEQAALSVEQAGQLARLLSESAPFSAQTPAGQIEFQGQGSRPAGEAGQRSVAEWARMVYLAAESGQPDEGLVLTWQRRGGIAGFCDNLSVYASGWASAASCRGGQLQELGQYRLDAAQLKQLYAWLDDLDYFEFQQQDPPGVADAMHIGLVFLGAGQQQPAQAEQEELALFAQRLYVMAARGALSLL